MKDPILSKLFDEFPISYLGGFGIDPIITGVVSDSRKVAPGNLFVAIGGRSADGNQYIHSAITKGAAAIVGDREAPIGIGLPFIRVENARKSLAYLAAAFYSNPARKLTMIGVTGTDGKTTTCNLLYKILLAAGLRVGLISTVNAVIGDTVLDTGFHVTTPDAPDVQYYLAKMLEAGLTHVILETTSHGWAQYRVDACEFDMGLITNITHEHLDYHGTYENYRAAKARLFTSLLETLPKPQGNIRLAVLNKDDSSFDYLQGIASNYMVSYSLEKEADYHAENIVYSRNGTDFDVRTPTSVFHVQSALNGAYNVSNCLAAIAAACTGLEIQVEVAAKGVAALTGVPGRMEKIALGQDFTAIVDFAHTPNALKVSLETAREMLPKGSKGRIIAIFGSAGLRDREKRRMMAFVGAGLADICILTAEDPRTESLDSILDEMARGAVDAGAVEGVSFWRVRDRGKAIQLGSEIANPGDIVIACGKGHEQSMCFGDIEYAWDDRTAMRAVLAQKLGQQGPKMPYLPTQDE